MNISCIFGFHDWSRDCEKCNRCGKTRSNAHDWSKDCEKCSRCGKVRSDAHEWAESKCSRCGRAKLNSTEQYELAAKLISGDGIRKDEDEAVRLLMSAADAGHIQAQELLGSTLRHRGEIAGAVVWLRKAADAGASGAQLELGMVYCSHDTYRDHSKAKECWKAVARAGNNQQRGLALANLGILYGNGLGVKPSPTKAILLLSAASALGNEPAVGMIAEFGPKLQQCMQSSPNAVRQMVESMEKLKALVDSGDCNTICSWVIDNLDSLA